MVEKAIYIASTDEASGKSAIIIALASIAMEMGKKVGYFKPIGIKSSIPGREHLDEDAEIMRTFLRLEHESNIICPFTLDKEEFLDEFVDAESCIRNIKASYEKISHDKDLMLIEGPHNFSVGSFINCPIPRLAKDLKAEILLVERVMDDSVVDDVLQSQDCCIRWGVNLFGVILNRISPDKMERVKHVIKPFIEKHGIKVLGLIPEDKNLSAPTAREICDFIGGRVLAGKDGLDKMIEAILIGAMTPDSAAKYFRRVTNELVITGGDRTDIILTALETDVSAIVLTGNLHPSAKVLPKADELKVPLILVPYDTYTTLQYIQKIIGKIKPRDSRRISTAVNLVREHVDWRQLIG